MDSMMTVDPWLLTLGEEGPEQRTIAAILARMQARVSSRTGHIPALNDEYNRRRIRAHARLGVMPDLMLRCLRCHAVASLKDWVRCADMDEAETAAALNRVLAHNSQMHAYFLQRCLGSEQAPMRIATLTDAQEWGGV